MQGWFAPLPGHLAFPNYWCVVVLVRSLNQAAMCLASVLRLRRPFRTLKKIEDVLPSTGEKLGATSLIFCSYSTIAAK